MIQFPTNPVISQEYVYEGKTWVWGGVSWDLKPFQETDPVFNASQAKNITATHISTLNNTSGVNTGDQDLSGFVQKLDNHSLVLNSEIEKLENIEANANNYTHPATHPASILDVVDVVSGDTSKFFNEKGGMVSIPHSNLTNKNQEIEFQHIDTGTIKETLASDDMVAIKDSESGKVVLTPRSSLEAIVNLDTIDTQLSNATEIQSVNVTPDKFLYFLGKLKISMANFMSFVIEQLQGIYAAINHNHTLASLSEKSYNSLTDKPTIPSIAGLMVESEYTGETGTKQVNYAKSADEAELAISAYSAQQDGLGREIHTTYALKQSGVTPPETARVILDDVTPTYTIEALTAENLIVENNATEDGEILAPVLAADKTLKISIIGNDTLLNGTSYADGVTIFAIYEASTETWTFNSILDPEVPDYSDMTVDIMLENPTVITSIGNGIILAQFIDINKTVFIRTHSTAIGIYQCVGLYSGNAYLELIAAGTALHTVRVKDGDVWYSQYDGKNDTSLAFTVISGTAKKEIKLFRDNALLAVTSFSFMIDEELNGWSVKSVSAYVPVASTSGTPTVTLTNLTTGNTITSTPVTIDENELTSLTAATPAVINPAYKLVATGNLLSVNLTVTGTGAKGMGIIITFEK